MQHGFKRGILGDYLSSQAMKYAPEVKQNQWEWLLAGCELGVRDERRGKETGHK